MDKSFGSPWYLNLAKTWNEQSLFNFAEPSTGTKQLRNEQSVGYPDQAARLPNLPRGSVLGLKRWKVHRAMQYAQSNSARRDFVLFKHV